MDDLYREARTQVALEGRGGCTLKRLWTVLSHELPIRGLKSLDSVTKQLTWEHGLLLHPNDIRILVKTEIIQELRIEMNDCEFVGVPQGMAVLTRLPDELRDVRMAAAHDLVLMASSAFKEGVLGLYDANTCTFKISDMQMLTLEAIAKQRRSGILQSEAAKQLGIEHKNFFFVITCLLSRDLITKNSMIVKSSCRIKHAPTHSTTNVLHLKRFSPAEKCQAMQAWKPIMDLPVDAAKEGGFSYSVQDDAKLIGEVCDTIWATKDKTVIEHELKKKLEYKKSKGHRQWRRLLKKMVDTNLVRIFVGTVDGQPVKCLEQLMAYDDWLQHLEAPSLPVEQSTEPTVVVETTLDRQIYDFILESGPHGATMTEIFGAFQLNSKSNVHRVKSMQNNNEVFIRFDNVGRTVVNRCIAKCYLTELLPPCPEACIELPTIRAPHGSWMKATFIAIEADDYSNVDELPEEGTAPSTYPLVPAQGKYPEKQPSTSDYHALDSSQPCSSQVVPAHSNVGEDGSCVPPYLHAHVMQSRADFRYDRLLEKLTSERFIIRGHVRSWLHKLETAAGYVNSKAGPDRRTVNQLMDRLVETTGAKKMMVSMMSKTGIDTRQTDVLIHSDVEVDKQLLKAIRSAHCDYETVTRQQSHVRVAADNLLQHGNSLPVMDNIERLLPTQNIPGCKNNPARRAIKQVGEGHVKMHDNGYISAKMTRVKLLHYLICRLVGLGGFDASSILLEDHGQSQASSVDAAASTRNTLDSSQPKPMAMVVHEEKDTAMVHSRPIVLLSNTSNEFRFSPRHLWDFMPLGLFMQIVGCKHEIDGLQDLCHQYQTLSELPKELQKRMIDDNARVRLSELLDVLCRMELIDSLVAASASSLGLHNCSKFIASRRGIFEEPHSDEESDHGPGNLLRTRVESYDLSDPDHLDNYWKHLEFVFTKKRDMSRSCFPATRAPEVCSRSGWATHRLMSMAQWLELVKRMDNEKENLNWVKCQELARDLNLNYCQVLTLSNDRRRRHRLEKLRAGEVVVTTRRHRLGSRSLFSKQRGKANSLGDRKLLRGRKKRVRKDPKNITLPVLPKGLGNEHLPHIIDEGILQNEVATEQAYWSKSQNLFLGKIWTFEEDRYLLSAFFAWRCSSRLNKNGANWKCMQCLPRMSSKGGLKQCTRRYHYIKKIKQVRHMLYEMETIAEKVFSKRVRRHIEEFGEWELKHQDCSAKGKSTETAIGFVDLLECEDAGDTIGEHGKRSRYEMDVDKSTPSHKRSKMDDPASFVASVSANCGKSLVHPVESHVRNTDNGVIDLVESDDCQRSGQERDSVGNAALDLFLEQCHVDDAKDVQHLRKLVDAAAKISSTPRSLAERSRKRRRECLSKNNLGLLLKASRFPEDLGSGIVARHKRMAERCPVQLGRIALLPCDGPMPLGVAAAKDTIVSLLYLSERTTSLTKQMAQHLSSKFNDKEIFQALGVLNKQGWVNPGGSRRPLCLSKLFKRMSSDQHSFRLFDQAAKTTEVIQTDRKNGSIPQDHPLCDFIGSDGRLVISRDDVIEDGTMAHLTAAITQGVLEFHATVEHEHDNDEGTRARVATRFGNGPSDPSVRVHVTRVEEQLLEFGMPQLSKASCAQPKRKFSEILRDLGVSKPPYTYAEVSHSSSARIDAERLLVDDMRGHGRADDLFPAFISEILTITRNAGEDGASLEEICSSVNDYFEEYNSPDIIEHILSKSVTFKLLRSIPGYTRCYYVASEHANKYMTGMDPSCAQWTQSPHKISRRQSGLAPSGQEYSRGSGDGTAQPNTELCTSAASFLSRPWLDHKGCINLGMLKLLQQKLMAAIIGAPGISEENLCMAVGFINPASAVELLKIMVAQGLCCIKNVEHKVPGPPKIFRKEEKTAIERSYFPGLPLCFSVEYPYLEDMEKRDENK